MLVKKRAIGKVSPAGEPRERGQGLYDYAIIGGGIVGLSTAWQLKRRLPDRSVLVIEKEAAVARHQSGHNSGVIHAGVYYRPGSMKARFCRAGVAATIRFCEENDVAYDQCGKLIVATDAAEVGRMKALFERCGENRIAAEWLGAEALAERDPRIAGAGAILVPSTGIADYPGIARAMARLFEALGGEIRLNARVTGLREIPDAVIVGAGGDAIEARRLVVCGGLMADRLARMMGLTADFRIVPFRGEYFRLPPAKNDIVRHLIYPVPDPAMPFLGVHLTRMIDGSVTVGPNAVLSFARERYTKGAVSARDVAAMACFGGFWRLMAKNLAFGVAEMRNSLSKRRYLEHCRTYCPELELGDLGAYPAGIRAMAVARDGAMLHDFVFGETPRSIHVCNAPSPAATSAIPIGGHILDKIIERFEAG